jgi:co-chaperonin GroES (HSP10)
MSMSKTYDTLEEWKAAFTHHCAIKPKKNMKPIGKYIVVKDVQESVKTESGLILSGEDTNQLRYKRAEVIAPGSDVSVIDKGDELYYDKAHSFTMLINDEQFTIISERDVVVVI